MAINTLDKIKLYFKYKNQIVQLLRYSLNDVNEYKHLTEKEKSIIKSEEEFLEIKSL